VLSRHHNAGQNRDIKIANRLFENVSQFKYFETTLTNQNLIQEEIKRRLNYANAFYHSFQNHSSSCLLISFKYIYIYPRSQLRIYWCYFSLSSKHVSAPSGQPSSGEIQLYISRKPSLLQRIRCFTICLLLSIYIMADALFK
jgi:hypothetical protein